MNGQRIDGVMKNRDDYAEACKLQNIFLAEKKSRSKCRSRLPTVMSPEHAELMPDERRRGVILTTVRMRLPRPKSVDGQNQYVPEQTGLFQARDVLVRDRGARCDRQTPHDRAGPDGGAGHFSNIFVLHLECGNCGPVAPGHGTQGADHLLDDSGHHGMTFAGGQGPLAEGDVLAKAMRRARIIELIVLDAHHGPGL